MVVALCQQQLDCVIVNSVSCLGSVRLSLRLSFKGADTRTDMVETDELSCFSYCKMVSVLSGSGAD